MKKSFSLDQIENIVKDNIIYKFKEYKIFTFNGPLGAGKTTFIKKILAHLGVRQIVTSPTFTYLNIYKTDDGKIFYHFDLYRMKSLKSFLDLGFDEYFFADFLCEKSWILVEWPRVIESLIDASDIKDKVCKIFLNYCTDRQDERMIEIC